MFGALKCYYRFSQQNIAFAILTDVCEVVAGIEGFLLLLILERDDVKLIGVTVQQMSWMMLKYK